MLCDMEGCLNSAPIVVHVAAAGETPTLLPLDTAKLASERPYLEYTTYLFFASIRNTASARTTEPST